MSKGAVNLRHIDRWPQRLRNARDGVQNYQIDGIPPARNTLGLGARIGLCYKSLNARCHRSARAMLTRNVMQHDVPKHVTLLQLKHVSAMFTGR